MLEIQEDDMGAGAKRTGGSVGSPVILADSSSTRSGTINAPLKRKQRRYRSEFILNKIYIKYTLMALKTKFFNTI